MRDKKNEAVPAFDPVLVRDENGLKLTDGRLEIRGDFTSMLPRLKQSNMERELLVKASRIKGLEGVPVAVDATAGMGEDSLLIAAAGYQVHLYESDPTIAALLGDTIERAKQMPELATISARMELHAEDSIAAMKRMAEDKTLRPDLIYLDPMFPERQKSASVKKKFQLIHQLERPCSNEIELLEAAIAAGPRKIIIKRPIKGPFLGSRKPDYSYSGKAIRYDCLIFSR